MALRSAQGVRLAEPRHRPHRFACTNAGVGEKSDDILRAEHLAAEQFSGAGCSQVLIDYVIRRRRGDREEADRGGDGVYHSTPAAGEIRRAVTIMAACRASTPQARHLNYCLLVVLLAAVVGSAGRVSAYIHAAGETTGAGLTGALILLSPRGLLVIRLDAAWRVGLGWHDKTPFELRHVNGRTGQGVPKRSASALFGLPPHAPDERSVLGGFVFGDNLEAVPLIQRQVAGRRRLQPAAAASGVHPLHLRGEKA